MLIFSLRGEMSCGDGQRPARIPHGVKVEGVVVAGRPLLIAGQPKGEYHSEHFVVGRQGAIEGSVRATELAIYGNVTGTINTGRLLIEDGARVEGEVFQRTLSIDQHAQVCALYTSSPEAGD